MRRNTGRRSYRWADSITVAVRETELLDRQKRLDEEP
ncbi:hypothetical protein VD0002_g3294 [Verticillium dahliae]|uniref:Uncharacterized protein n=1 Tax=Verticillium dahliae TaxID=27337 RepID=A0AA44WG79_VERDA|nr:hypothetical protein BJF96_g5774 [Verticillium dahliae]PNH41044.1 hypothetical protein VD0004_g6038 [Verticillium dahliae]PNH52412.1 hypothetical protein VD0003_g4903 [Verticillium dahliae]PNH65859.1 hypothetical protein VD0002_g3294 [Verticillium dahliae]PNH71663.1 hypothetical protein VD0001_g5880 [Verticillium dahliae]